MINNPLVSVIVPCYNQAQYLDECLQSVLDQTYSNWECIMVNDGSPDNTEHIAKTWSEKDDRFKYVYKENGGLSSARNAGLEIAKGEWIQFLDCDDKIDVRKFEESSKYFSSFDLIVTGFKVFNLGWESEPFCVYKNKQLNFEILLLEWDLDFIIPIHCALFRREYSQVFDLSLKAKEDWLFWLNYVKNNPRFIIIDKPMAFYRENNSGMTRNKSFMMKNELLVHQKIYSILQSNSVLQEKFVISRFSVNNKFILELYTEINRLSESKRYKIGDSIVRFLQFFKFR